MKMQFAIYFVASIVGIVSGVPYMPPGPVISPPLTNDPGRPNPMSNDPGRPRPLPPPPMSIPTSLNVSQMLIPNNAQYQQTVFNGVPALQVSETAAYNAAFSSADVNKTNQGNAYVTISTVPFFEGTIDVDMAAVRNNFSYLFPITPTQNLLVGAMAGISFRQQSNNQYDAIYLRTGAGRLNNPAPTAPLSYFGAQYISPPTWIFSKLQQSMPQYTTGADVAEGQWTHISLTVFNNTLTVWVGNNPTPVFNKIPLLGAGLPGPIGLFVETGTVAYFANLRVSPSIPLNLF